jgi:hypothetical protein
MSKQKLIQAAEIPPHMLADPVSNAQRKAFGKAAGASKPSAKKSAAKKVSSDAGLKRSTSRARGKKASPAAESSASE